MSSRNLNPPFSLALLIFLILISSSAKALKFYNVEEDDASGGAAGFVVRRDQRRLLAKSEDGEISSIDVSDGRRGPYHVQFITMEPNSLFLPVLLHADMIFYVHTGSGKLNWALGKDDEMNRLSVKRGDIIRLQPGSVFFIQSDLQTQRHKLRIYAIFANNDDDVYDPIIGAYSSVRDLVRGFDTRVLRAAFQVTEEVIESISNSTDQSAIVHALPTKKETFWDLETRFLKTFLLASHDGIALNKKHKKDKKKKDSKTYNIFEEDPDFKNCNGWSLTVNEKNAPTLEGSNIGLFMVNLTKGSMMGPHWNPMATEIAIVLHGEGMVRVVCSSTAKKSQCRNMRFLVQEGDVFAVPMFHPMAQLSYNNDSLVFMGFSTTTRKNYPQFLAGKYSVLQTLNREVLAVSLNVTNTTADQLLAAQADSIILDCTSCAEEEERVMLEEAEKERKEEEDRRREEERKREEEAEREGEQEEEKRQEEEREREEARRQDEERKRQEQEEARRQEEKRERARQKEEAAAAEREREEARRQEEERKRQEQEEEERERERQKEEAAAAEREQEQEEEARRQEQEEDARRQEEERQQQEREEEEEDRRQEEERAQQEQEEDEETRRQQEEAAGQEEEAGAQQEEDYRRRREEEAQTEQEEAGRQQEDIEGRGRQEEGWLINQGGQGSKRNKAAKVSVV